MIFLVGASMASNPRSSFLRRKTEEAVLTTCHEDADCPDSECIQSTCLIKDPEDKVYFFKQGGTGDGSSSTLASGNLKSLPLKGGDTLYLMGTITNLSYNSSYVYGDVSDSNLWKNNDKTLAFSKLRGSAGKYITIRSYDDNTIIKGDGSNIIRLLRCRYLRLIGLNVYGETERIPVGTAEALQFVYKDSDGTIKNRLDDNTNGDAGSDVASMTFPKLSGISRPSYTDMRGFYASNCDHIVIENSKIHHSPGTGLRISKSEYVDIIGNEIYDCSRRSYSGTHGLVPTLTKDNILNDPAGTYRVRVLGNKIYNNYNEIYSWAPTKTIITPHIDEGKGISLQRNRNFLNNGRILVANNIAHNNGFSGIHSNDGKNIDIIGNTAYLNSYTNSEHCGGIVKGKNVGISVQGGRNNTMANNIVVIDTDTQGFAYSVGRQSLLEAKNNLQYGIGDLPLISDDEFDTITTITQNPKFEDAANFDFRLESSSMAKTAGDPVYAKLAGGIDFAGNTRDSVEPSLGALEYIE